MENTTLHSWSALTKIERQQLARDYVRAALCVSSLTQVNSTIQRRVGVSSGRIELCRDGPPRRSISGPFQNRDTECPSGSLSGFGQHKLALQGASYACCFLLHQPAFPQRM